MGIYGTQSTWAEFFGKGPGGSRARHCVRAWVSGGAVTMACPFCLGLAGISVVCMGFAVIITAGVGIYGEKRDNKCLLLLVRRQCAAMGPTGSGSSPTPAWFATAQYFLVLTASFMVLIVMGAIATFDKGTINDKFSSWWDKYPDAAAKVRRAHACAHVLGWAGLGWGGQSTAASEFMHTCFLPCWNCARVQGQKDFNCCGYADMTDRPVGAWRTSDATALTDTCTLAHSRVLMAAVVCLAQERAGDCATEVPDATQGCKEVGLEYMRTRFVPLFLCTFIFGLCQVR